MASVNAQGWGSVGRSIGVIAVLEYLRGLIIVSTNNVMGDYTGLIARAIVTYLEFAAYAQGYISIPVTGLLSA